MMSVPVKVAFGPSHIGDSVIARVIETMSGDARVETWSAEAKDWVRGGAFFGEFSASPLAFRPI